MSLKIYQDQIEESVQGLAKHYWEPLSILAYIAEEVGEVSRIVNAQFGEKPPKPGEVHDALEDELADVIYAVLCLANSQGLSLDASLEKTIAKLQTRDKDRFEKA